MAVPVEWVEVRRSDRELVGWLRPAGDDWVPVDLLGRDVSASSLGFARAETVLEERGLGFLAERWSLTVDDGEVAVRLSEVSTSRIIAVLDDYGSASAVTPGREPVRWVLPWPAPDELRLR
jgi:hypothetical protein